MLFVWGGALLSSCSDGGSKKESNNKVTVKYPTLASLAAISESDGTTTPTVEWNSAEVSIGSSNTVTKADLSTKLKALVTSNTDLAATLNAVVDEMNADLEDGDTEITIDDLTISFYDEDYFDFATEDYIKADLSELDSISKDASVYALPYYEESSSVTYKAEEITEAELAAMSPVPSAGTNTKLNAGTYSIWGGKGAIVTAASKMAVQINTGKTVPVAIVSATSITGSNATAVPVEGETISLVNYVLVDTPTTGKMSVVLNISCDASSKALSEAGFDGASYWIIVTDEDGTILKIKPCVARNKHLGYFLF